MGPLFSTTLLALLCMAASLPQVGSLERALAVAGLFLLLIRRRPWSLTFLAIAVGLAASLRVQVPLGLAQDLDGYGGPAWVSPLDESRGDLRRARFRLPDGRGGTAWISGTTLEAGADALVALELWLPPERRNPDDRGRGRAALAGGAVLRGRVSGDPVAARGPRRVSPLARIRGRVRAWLRRGLDGSSSLWLALLLADRSAFPEDFMQSLQRLGLAHLLALSGLHVGLLVGASALVGGRGRPPFWIVLPLGLWLLLAGGGPSLLRAVVMVAWMLAGRRLGRRADATEALAFAAWLELCLWPWRLSGVGWWLSYGATLSLLRAQALLRRLPRALGLLGLTLVAQAGGAPWVLSAFGQWPWVSPLSNLTLGVLFAPFLLSGFVLLLAAALVPGIAESCLAALQLLSHVFCWLLLRAATLAPGALGHPGIGGAAWGAALTAWACLLVPFGAFRWRCCALLLALLLPHAQLLRGRAAEWWSLDVGQGDAGVYREATGAWLVVDLGPAFADYSAARAVVEPFLRRRNAKGVELLLTHGHRDHYGGARDLIARGVFARVHVARADSGRAWTLPLLRASAAAGCEWNWLARGDTLRVGAELLPVLWPPAPSGDLHTNDRSLVLRLGPPSASLLLTGDTESAAESAMLAGEGLEGVEILKLAHHGADTSSGEAWLARLAPSEGLISCAAVNRYGHPHPSTLARLDAAGVRAWRTDRQGALHLCWDGAEYRVESVR